MVFSILGGSGQELYHTLDRRRTEKQQRAANGVREPKVLERLLNSSWSPLKVISDEDYELLLREKLSQVDAEISVIDEQIKTIRATAVSVKDDSKP
jgi:hypothetical protein